jgi:hypothetical protein
LAPMANCESPKCGFLHFSTFQVLAGVHSRPRMGSTPSDLFKCTRTHDAVDPY